jgi:hypothetical protein
VLLRLAYLGVTNAFAMLRLLPMSDREKDVEILALRHQIAVLERQLTAGSVPRDRPGVPGVTVPRPATASAAPDATAGAA